MIFFILLLPVRPGSVSRLCLSIRTGYASRKRPKACGKSRFSALSVGPATAPVGRPSALSGPVRARLTLGRQAACAGFALGAALALLALRRVSPTIASPAPRRSASTRGAAALVTAVGFTQRAAPSALAGPAWSAPAAAA